MYVYMCVCVSQVYVHTDRNLDLKEILQEGTGTERKKEKGGERGE